MLPSNASKCWLQTLISLLPLKDFVRNFFIFVEFPGEQPSNYIVIKGMVQDNFKNYHPIKYILPTNYP